MVCMVTHLTTFSYAELEAATSSFAATNMLSEDGGFGDVFHGMLRGQRVAVKMVRRQTPEGREQFLQEVETLSRCHHENILPLIGSMSSDSCWCLVYSLRVNGSLASARDPPPRRRGRDPADRRVAPTIHLHQGDQRPKVCLHLAIHRRRKKRGSGFREEKMSA